MKIILDIPDTVVPSEIKQLIDGGKCTEEQNRQIVKAFLELALDEFDNCQLSTEQYRLVMK